MEAIVLFDTLFGNIERIASKWHAILGVEADCSNIRLFWGI
jgi:hypothetical protein